MMPKTRLSALLSLLLVFASGILVGAVAYRLYMVRTVATAPSAPHPSPEEVRRHIIAEMRDRIKLDDRQVEQLNQIFDRTRQEFDALHKESSQESRAIWDRQRAQVHALLRADQVSAYEQYQKERDEARRRHEQAEHKGPPGPRPSR